MKYIIDKAELKGTSKGTILKVDLVDENGVLDEGVTIWNNFPNFASLKTGSEVNGSVVVKKNGQYTNKSLYEDKTSTIGTPRGTGIKAAQERKAVMIEKAQDRKNESIAYFNSLNVAIQFVAAFSKNLEMGEAFDSVVHFRDLFLQEWQKYERSDTTDKHNPF